MTYPRRPLTRLALGVAALAVVSLTFVGPAVHASGTPRAAAAPSTVTGHFPARTLTVRNGSAQHGLSGWHASSAAEKVRLHRVAGGPRGLAKHSVHVTRVTGNGRSARVLDKIAYPATSFKVGATYLVQAWAREVHGSHQRIALSLANGHNAHRVNSRVVTVKRASNHRWHKLTQRLVATTAAHSDTGVSLSMSASRLNWEITGVSVRQLATTVTTSPAAMPVGNLTDWHQVMAENFTTDLATGSWPGSYAPDWSSYDGFSDTSGIGEYEPAKTLSVHGGDLDIYLHTADGTPLGAAPEPHVNGKPGGQIYGRYSIRWKGASLPGYGLGWLLWSDANNWKQGEIDWPEGSLDSTIKGFDHQIGNPQHNVMAYDSGVSFAGWHTTTIQWTPSGVGYYLDGKLVASSTESPSSSMHLVMATATNGTRPAASTAGHVLVDWVTIYTWTGKR